MIYFFNLFFNKLCSPPPGLNPPPPWSQTGTMVAPRCCGISKSHEVVNICPSGQLRPLANYHSRLAPQQRVKETFPGLACLDHCLGGCSYRSSQAERLDSEFFWPVKEFKKARGQRHFHLCQKAKIRRSY
jgi:hypothetical protein